MWMLSNRRRQLGPQKTLHHAPEIRNRPTLANQDQYPACDSAEWPEILVMLVLKWLAPAVLIQPVGDWDAL